MSASKICMVTSEMAPFAKTGGLADVTGALLRRLTVRGHDVRAFMPLFGSIRAMGASLKPVAQIGTIEIAIGAARYRCTVRTARMPASNALVYFIDCPELYGRASLYTLDPDEHRRFLFLGRAAIESCQRLGFAPHIFHCHDWHTACVPLQLKRLYGWDRLFAHSRTVLTIHNIGYQGIFPSSAVADLSLGSDLSPLDPADLARGEINCLKTGVRHADAVTTVSPTYAREICTTELGMGLQGALSARGDAVVGILNGVDYDEWDPRIDPYLSVHFWTDDLRGKQRNKQLLQERFKLPSRADRPIVAMITRLAAQKGVELLQGAMPALMAKYDFALIVLASGEARYVTYFNDLMARAPERVGFFAGYDEQLAHLIEAGADIFLMPSRYEPCGLNQMYSLRYGTIPVVRRTGGLADSVVHADLAAGTGTGFVFNDFDVGGVSWGVSTALEAYARRDAWRALMRRAMAQDFSWTKQIGLYEELYQRLAGG
jgi:starch synthase